MLYQWRITEMGHVQVICPSNGIGRTRVFENVVLTCIPFIFEWQRHATERGQLYTRYLKTAFMVGRESGIELS